MRKEMEEREQVLRFKVPAKAHRSPRALALLLGVHFI